MTRVAIRITTAKGLNSTLSERSASLRDLRARRRGVISAEFPGVCGRRRSRTMVRDAIVMVPARQTAALSLLVVVAVPLTSDPVPIYRAGMIWPLAAEGPHCCRKDRVDQSEGAALLGPTQRQPRMAKPAHAPPRDGRFRRHAPPRGRSLATTGAWPTSNRNGRD
jgi:hypothetical protein